MERRGLLKTGLGLGAWLAAERLGGPVPAEAAASRPRFFSGYLYGRSVSGWPLWLGWFGSRARGFCYAPESIGTQTPVGFRVDGRVQGAHLSAQLYEATDRGLHSPFGNLSASLTRGGRGNYDLDGYGSGQFSVLPATVDGHRMSRIVGTYSAVASDEHLSPLYNGTLRLQSNGKFQITHVHPPGADTQPGVPTRLSGWFMISREMDVWIFPTPISPAPNTPCATDPMACLPVYCCPLSGNPTTVRIQHPLTGCVGSGYFHL